MWLISLMLKLLYYAMQLIVRLLILILAPAKMINIITKKHKKYSTAFIMFFIIPLCLLIAFYAVFRSFDLDFLPGIIFTVISVIRWLCFFTIIAFLFKRVTACSKCNTWDSMIVVSRDLIDTRFTTVTEDRTTTSGNTTIITTSAKPITEDTFEDEYRCTVCGHKHKKNRIETSRGWRVR